VAGRNVADGGEGWYIGFRVLGPGSGAGARRRSFLGLGVQRVAEVGRGACRFRRRVVRRATTGVGLAMGGGSRRTDRRWRRGGGGRWRRTFWRVRRHDDGVRKKMRSPGAGGLAEQRKERQKGKPVVRCADNILSLRTTISPS
jgi:hypothetical protein